MKGIFLDKWDRQFRKPNGDSDSDLVTQSFEEWSIGLGKMKDEHIAAALDHCRNNLDWPPSIHDFKEAGNPRGYFDEESFQEFAVALPKPQATAELRVVAKKAGASIANEETGMRRTTENIKNGIWTEKLERPYQQHCQILRIDCGNPLNLSL